MSNGRAALGALALALAGAAWLLAGCARPAEPATLDGTEEKVVNVYNWSDYIAPDVIPGFERETGIKVNYDVFDSNEVIETKLLTGRTGYDIVTPSAHFMQRQIAAGVFQKLDKSRMPNFGNLDPAVTRMIEVNDPGDQYNVVYTWGTSGIGYNVDKVKAVMPQAPVDSLDMIFNPQVVSHFKDCGVSVLDAPEEVTAAALIYLGRDPGSERLEDLQAAERVLLAMRPYVRYIHSSKYIEDLANGEICLAFAWSGDVMQAAARANESANGVHVAYHIAHEGATSFFDVMAIPADAPHPHNAMAFLNYLLRPDVSAKNSNLIRYASPVAKAYPLVDPAIRDNPDIYPTPAVLARLHPLAAHSLAFSRQLNRMWTRFKTGR